MTTPNAQRPLSSRLMVAIAATQGVYNKQKTSKVNAVRGVSQDVIAAVDPKSTLSVLTTLSFAIKPLISAVVIFQSPKPKGAKIGDIQPASIANMLR